MLISYNSNHSNGRQIYYEKRNNNLFLKTNSYTMWKQILEYLYLRKKDPNAPKSLDLKFMHGMNRISIFMFLFALIVLLIRYIRS